MPSGGISYPGLEGTISWQFTLSQGIVPSTGSIEIPVGRGLPRESGDLELWFENDRLRLRGCRIGSASYSSSASGRTIILQILDRRWKWAFGRIDGVYNTRLPNNEVDPDWEKTPRELANLLLEAMGETGDVSALPDFARPEIDWTAANPAQELQSLCEQLGCRVVWNPANDRVQIVAQGRGRDLPSGGTLSRGDGIDPDEKPDWLDFVAGPTRHESQLKLEAVGLDDDERIKPIHELSYAPAGGWQSEWPEVMAGVSDRVVTLRDGTKTTARELALQSVFRWYRVTDEQQIPNFDGPVGRKDLLPIGNTLVDTYEDPDGVKVSRPAYIVGVGWHDGLKNYANIEPGTKLNVQYDEETDRDAVMSFGVDAQKGIVRFSKPVVKLDVDAGTIGPAEIRLVTAVTVRDPENHQIKRFTLSRALGRNPTRSSSARRVIRHDEVQLQVRGVYSNDGRLIDKTDNRDETERQADYYLDGAQAEYDAPVTDDRVYPGLRFLELDGAIQQVTWSYSESGYTTRASRGTEHSLARPTHKQFVQMQKLSEPATQQLEQTIKSLKKQKGA